MVKIQQDSMYLTIPLNINNPAKFKLSCKTRYTMKSSMNLVSVVYRPQLHKYEFYFNDFLQMGKFNELEAKYEVGVRYQHPLPTLLLYTGNI